MKTGVAYLVAIAAMVIAVLIRWTFDPWIGNNVPFATLYGATAFAVWFGGYRPGLAAVIFGYIVCNFLFFEPRNSLAIRTAGDWLALLLYLTTSGLIVGITESMRRAQRRAEAAGRELQNAAETIRRQAAIVQAVNDNTAELIFMKDRAGRLTYANAATLRVIGMTAEQAIGSVDRDNFTEPAEHSAISQNDRFVAETGQSLRAEEAYTDCTGREHVFLSTKSPLRDAHGEITGVIGVSLDITDRKRHEKELEDNRKTLFALVDHCPFGIYIVDDDFRILNMNAKSQNGAFANVRPLLGRRFDEALRILWPESVAAGIIARFRHTLDTGEPFCSSEFVSPRADIDLTEGYEWELHRITLANGRHGVVCYYFDSTKLRQTEAALRDAQEQLAAELSATTRLHNLSTRLLAADDLATALNDLLENAIAATKADFGSVQLYDRRSESLGIVAQKGLGAEFLEHFRAVKVDGGSACGEAMRIGTRHIVEDVMGDAAFEPHRDMAAAAGFRAVQSTPLMEPNGNVMGVLSTYYRTPQRPTERDEQLLDQYAQHAADLIQRLRLEQALKEADRLKNEFLATLAHELRNPLAPISSAVQLLDNIGPHDESLPALREVIERNVNYMVRLVDDLLEVSRITTGKIELRWERVNLPDVVQNAIETSSPGVKTRGHELLVTLPPDPVPVAGDGVRLTQVVANLLNNAAKYTPDGGCIWVSVATQEGAAVLKVRDNGPGIPDEMLDKVFDLFTQIKDGRHRLQGGLGIGLALVRRLVNMHDGTVEARSAPGGGAEFVVRLPLMTDVERQPEVDSPGMNESDCVPRRILVVDDNVDAATCLAMLLSVDGHSVATAHDGQAAIDKVKAFHPDVVLLDLGMPLMDGFEAAQKIRRLPGGREIVLAALTGWGQEKDRRRALEAGFDFHLVKPVRSRDLRSVLNGTASADEVHSSQVTSRMSASQPAIPGERSAADGPGEVPALPEEPRSSRMMHDLGECFFGIRMAAEVLETLEFVEKARDKAQRMMDSIHKDCQRGSELTAELRRRLSSPD